MGEGIESQRPRSTLTGRQISSAPNCGGFGLHSVSAVAEQVPPALSNPDGSRQRGIQKHVRLVRCLAGIKRWRMIDCLAYIMLAINNS